MNIKITGISGFTGSLIAEALKQKGHEVSGIQRDLLYGEHSLLAKQLSGCEVVINLAGSTILCRWSEKNRNLIYNSRIVTTNNLVRAIRLLPAEKRPKKMISASAIGIYSPGKQHDETSLHYSHNFLGKVVNDWEKCLESLPPEVNATIFRLGLVIGKNSKIIRNQMIPFKLGLGAIISNGQQPFPFIHEKDMVKAFLEAADSNFNGVYNLAAPEKVNYSRFAHAYAKILNRPLFIKIPAYFLKLALGEAASLLLENPEIVPKRLLERGFQFDYPTIEKSIENSI